jgi:hypothetical protein
MSDQQQPPDESFGRSSREQRRTAETVALGREDLAQLRAQAQQQPPAAPAPPAPPAPPAAAAPQPAASQRPVNHTALAIGLAVGVVVLLLILAVATMS